MPEAQTTRSIPPASFGLIFPVAEDDSAVSKFNDSLSISRRKMLVASSAVLISGCGKEKKKAQPTGDVSSIRRDVPLRVTYVGSDEDAERLKRSWAAVVEQQLNIMVSPLSRVDPTTWANDLAEKSSKSDVVIIPLMAVAGLFADEQLLAFRDEDLVAWGEQSGDLLQACHTQSDYDGNPTVMPLGGQVPALVTAEETDPITTWDQYDQWVQKVDGKAAEPLAPGWSAAMFLWRAASSIESEWLFERDTMQPLLESDEYVAVLDQMQQTVSRYSGAAKTPTQIWTELQDGSLDGGIAIEPASKAAESQLFVSNLPGPQGENRILLDPMTPVACLASSCRQTAASKQFISWISGGEGSETVRQNLPGFSTVRRSNIQSSERTQKQTSGYQQWLEGRLQTAVTVPPLQLIDAAEYYQTLDRGIIEGLANKADPKQTLLAISKQWNTITKRVGIKTQRAAWRRSAG